MRDISKNIYKLVLGMIIFILFLISNSYIVLAENNSNISFEKSSTTVIEGSTFSLDILINTDDNISIDSWYIGKIIFDTNYIRVYSVTLDPLWTTGSGFIRYDNGTINNTTGEVTGIQSFIGDESSINSTNSTTTILCSIEFYARKDGRTDVNLTDVGAFYRGPDVLLGGWSNLSIRILASSGGGGGGGGGGGAPPSGDNNPTADAGGPYSIEMGQTISLDATSSTYTLWLDDGSGGVIPQTYDADGNAILPYWSIGGVDVAFGLTPEIQYNELVYMLGLSPGMHELSLNLTLPLKGSDTAVAMIEVLSPCVDLPDFDDDCDVDFVDFALFSPAWGTDVTNPLWDVTYDISSPYDVINWLDLSTLAHNLLRGVMP